MTALDNPFWHSLASVHAPLAQSSGALVRFPPAYAPFLAVADAEVACTEDDLECLIPGREQVYLLGVAPRIQRAGWRLQPLEPLLQLVFAAPADWRACQGHEQSDVIALGPAQLADVLALTARVYSHYFRQRTMELGRYFGVYRDMQLAAMIGERMGSADTREMSAICTYPDFRGHGYAARMTAMLSLRTLQDGRLPYLHVSARNTRAIAVYERVGYRLRRTIGFWSLGRTPD